MKALQEQFKVAKENYIGKFDSAEKVKMSRYFDIETAWLMSMLVSDTKLRSCSELSLRKVLANVVTTGLTLSPAMRYCYVIPRRVNGEMTANLDISYMGLIHLLTSAGTVSSVEAHVVYANDHFTCVRGLEPEFMHKPVLSGRGDMVAVYSIAHIRGAEPQIELLTADDIKDIQAVAGARGEIWSKWAAEMWRKSAIKRQFKYLPKHQISDELIAALSIEHTNDATMIATDDIEPETLEKIFTDNTPVVLQEPAPEKPISAKRTETPEKQVEVSNEPVEQEPATKATKTTKKASKKAETKQPAVTETVVPDPKVVQLNTSREVSKPMNGSSGGLQSLLVELT